MSEMMSGMSDEMSEEDMREREPSRLEQRRAIRAASPARAAVNELASSGALDGLFSKIDAGQIELTGDGGFANGLLKATLERGLQVELSDHLGYDKGDPEAPMFPNSRNGTSPKTVSSQAGQIDLAVPRDREGTFTPRLVPKGSRRLGGVAHSPGPSTFHGQRAYQQGQW